MTHSATFIDPLTKETYALDGSLWRAPNGNSLMISDLPGITRAEIDTSKRSIWRYSKALPLSIDHPVSLGEGCTPLVSSRIDDLQFHFKLEWFAPTGSFKDRGVSVLVSFLKQMGITQVVEDSSGNAGASIAAYGAAANIDVTILVPDYTQPSKIVQSRAYGADVILIPGAREDTALAAIDMAQNTFYASHSWHPMFLQGTKSLGYELWEDLGFAVPDNIVIPASEGSNILGCYIAFKELLRSGEIDRMPRLFVTQPENCAPLHHGIQGSRQKEFRTTIAEGTAIKSPIRLETIVKAIKETNGGSVTATESEIINACKRLAQAGMLTEPSSAHAWVGARKLIDMGRIKRSDETVIILTGSGLKAPNVFSD